MALLLNKSVGLSEDIEQHPVPYLDRIVPAWSKLRTRRSLRLQRAIPYATKDQVHLDRRILVPAKAGLKGRELFFKRKRIAVENFP